MIVDVGTPYATKTKMLAMVPDDERAEMLATYRRTREGLLEVFPRGRIRIAEEGRAILVSRSAALRGCNIYVCGPGKLGLFYGRKQGFLAAIPGDLIEWRIPCAGEGILILRADPRLEAALPQFSKGMQRGGGLKALEKAWATRGATRPAVGGGLPFSRACASTGEEASTLSTPEPRACTTGSQEGQS